MSCVSAFRLSFCLLSVCLFVFFRSVFLSAQNKLMAKHKKTKFILFCFSQVLFCVCCSSSNNRHATNPVNSFGLFCKKHTLKGRVAARNRWFLETFLVCCVCTPTHASLDDSSRRCTHTRVCAHTQESTLCKNQNASNSRTNPKSIPKTGHDTHQTIFVPSQRMY